MANPTDVDYVTAAEELIRKIWASPDLSARQEYLAICRDYAAGKNTRAAFGALLKRLGITAAGGFSY